MRGLTKSVRPRVSGLEVRVFRGFGVQEFRFQGFRVKGLVLCGFKGLGLGLAGLAGGGSRKAVASNDPVMQRP